MIQSPVSHLYAGTGKAIGRWCFILKADCRCCCCICAGSGDMFEYRDIALALLDDLPVHVFGVPPFGPLCKGLLKYSCARCPVLAEKIERYIFSPEAAA